MSSSDESDKQYLAYLERKHNQWATSREIIESCIQEAVHQQILSLERIVEGEVNEVYRVRTTAGEDLVIRISREEYPRFSQEEWVIDQVRARGVPAPVVLLTTSRKVNERNFTFCVEKMMPGQALRKTEVSEEEKAPILRQIGKYLSRIHEVSVPYPGWDFLEGDAAVPTWLKYFQNKLEEPELVRIAEKRGIPVDHIHQALTVFRDNSAVFEVERNHLLHGDLSAKHILIEEKKVSGIIDFEDARGGDPVYDLARWCFFEEGFLIQHLVEGYEHPEWIRDYSHKISIYHSVMALDLLSYYDSEEHESGIEHCRRKLTALVDGGVERL